MNNQGTRCPDMGTRGVPLTKRLFDLSFVLLSSPLWVPPLLLGSLAVLIFSGRPVFYVSKRRVYKSDTLRLIKFRAMVKNAAQIANRQTIPVQSQRFLNISPDSPLYTPVGRWIERLFLTELPQFLHVLSGNMTLVGNRPLPEDVVKFLKDKYPYAESRFLTRCGIFGPVQLVGRQSISDAERLNLEIAYCRYCAEQRSLPLDLALLVYTALVLLRIAPQQTPKQVEQFMAGYATYGFRNLFRTNRSAKPYTVAANNTEAIPNDPA